MLKVHAGKQFAGNLFKSDTEAHKFYFLYDEKCESKNAISLTMPVINTPYGSDYKLHPIFDMNLPEGILSERLQNIQNWKYRILNYQKAENFLLLSASI